MTITLVVSAVCLLVLGGAVGVTALRAGRDHNVVDERNKPHTAYELARPKPVDLFFMARRRLLGPLVDAEYGSATFVAATQAKTFEVRVSTTGLLARPVPSGPVP